MLTAIDVGTQAVPDALLHLGYVYDEFGYDGQNRVTGAFGATYSYQPSGRFDRFVGLTFAYGTGQAAGSNRAPLHGVVSTAAGGAFAYDLAGNMVSRKTHSAAPVQTLAWSQANELLSVTTGATVESYRYDADGARIYQESKTGGALTWQQFDYFPHYTVKVAGGTTTATKYYFFNGQRIAQRVGDTLTYLHADHLGSTVFTTNVSGNQNQKYHAYGATRSGAVPSDYQFTGQEADSGTGLIYMQARYYDPVIGQFISPDTFVPDPNNLYAYNRYMYGYGNPLKYNDPTGHETNKPDWWPDWLAFPYDLPDGMTREDFGQWLAENNIPTVLGGQGGGDLALGVFFGGQASVEVQYLINFYSGEITYAYDIVAGTRIGTPQAAATAHVGVTFFAGATRNGSIIGASEYSAVDSSLQALGDASASAIVAQAQNYHDANGNQQFDIVQESTTGALIDPGLNRTVDSLAVNLGIGVDPVPIPIDGGASGGLISTRELGTVNLYDAARSFFGDLFRPVINAFQ